MSMRTGYVHATGIAASADAFAANWITNGYAGSLRSDGSLTMRNSAASAGMRFTSGIHEYDPRDVGIVRGGAGLIAITDGGDGPGRAGSYRDVQLRSLNPVSGNVGIGTTSPANQLDIWSGANQLMMVGMARRTAAGIAATASCMLRRTPAPAARSTLREASMRREPTSRNGFRPRGRRRGGRGVDRPGSESG